MAISFKNWPASLPEKKAAVRAFCSDTSYDEKIIPIMKNCNLLYHESTFLNDKIELAKVTKHSTAEQAATIAKKANVDQLLLGHFSSRYKSIEDFKTEAANIFPNTILSEEGKIIEIN